MSPEKEIEFNMNQSNRTPLIDALLPQARPMALEQRFMFDAAAVTAVTDPQYAPEAVHSDSTTNDSELARFAEPATVSSPVTVRALEVALNNGRKEVAFIDTGVAGYQTLVDGVRAGVEIVLLDTGQDGLAQMALWAQSHSGYDAIHIFSHGENGALYLGNAVVSNASIQSNTLKNDFSELGRSLLIDGDLLIYGCEVAQNTDGQQLVNLISSITQADVAASTDITGAVRMGGNWTLEYQSGPVEANFLNVYAYSSVLSITGTTVTQYDYRGNTVGAQWYQASVGAGYEYPDDGSIKEDWDPVANTYTLTFTSNNYFIADKWINRFSRGSLDYFTSVTRTSGTDTNLSATYNGKDIIISVANMSVNYTTGNSWTFTFTSVDVATGPTVTGITSSSANGTYKVGDTISLQANFSQAVNVTDTPQLTLETGSTDRTINYVSGSGTSTLTFNYTVQAGDTTADLDYISTAALTLNGGSIKDGSNNNATLTLASPGAANSLGANKAIVIDGVVPTVSGVTSSTANATYKVGDTVSVQVNFSEAVTVTGTPQLTLETGTTDRTINYASGSGTNSLTFTYIVQAGDTTADLDYNATTALALNSGTIKDAAGNNATLTLASPGAANSLGTNKAIVIDGVAPTVSGVTSSTANSAYKVGDTVSVQVNFSEAVTVTGTPQLTLETGTTDRTINYASGSGTSSLTFTYTVQAGDTTADLDYISTAALALNSGTIKDTAGNNATLTLASPGGANSLGANKNIVVDGLAPSAVALTNSSLSSSASANTTVGTLSSTDTTAGETFTYSLVAGSGSTHNASFSISGSSLVATNPSALSAGSYFVRVRTTDAAGNSFEQAFTITVTSNQAPVVTTPTTIALTDTSTTDTFSNQTGTVSATDTDGIASYGIQGGATGGSTVVGADTYDVSKLGTYGTLYVKSIGGAYVYVPNASAINGRLANTSETFTVTATDSNASAATGTATLTVNITGANDFPTDIGLTATSVNQSGGANATVGTLSTTDADTGDTHTYTLVSGAGDTNNALFNISGTSLRATNAATMTPGTYTVRVQTTDAANTTYAEAMTITVVDDVAPTVASVAVPSNAWYVAGQNLDLTVNFSESVTVNTTGGTPRMALTVGTTTVYATYVSGSGTSALVFRYIVQANDLDTNGIVLGTLALNGGALADAAGNNAVLTLNSVGSTSSVLVDAATPSVPSTPDLALVSDSGTSNSDNITSDTTPTLTGTAEAGSTVTLYDTDGTTVLGTTTATGGNWSITSSTLSSGSHTITAKVTDAAGNVSSASSGLAITIDATAPSAVALSTTSLADTMATSGSTLATLSATDTSGLTYSLVAGSGDTNNGRFTITGTDLKAGGSNLAAGTYDIRVRATDAAGNFTDQTFTVTVTAGPSVASINRAGASALTNATSVDYTVTYNESVTGVDASDFVLTTTGTAVGTIASISGSGTTYTVTVNSLSGVGTLRLDLNNSGTGIVNGGAQAITGGYTSGQTYTLDTSSPTAPTGLDLDVGSDSGTSNTDNVTSDNTPTVSGAGAEPGSTVTLYDSDGTTALGTTTADGAGAWTITSSALSNGVHTLTAKVTDGAGNTGAASTPLSVTIDTTAPSVPGAIDLDSGSDTGLSNSDNVTSDTTPTFNGTAEANSKVTLYDTDGTTVLGTTTADGSGNWTITSSTLAGGSHTLTVKAKDAAGNDSGASSSLSVTIDTTAPNAPTGLDLLAGSDSGTSNTDNITSNNTPTVSGAGAEPGSTVTLYDTNGTTVLGTATADSSGNWSVTTSTLADGAHTLTAKVTDTAGNVGAASSSLTVTIDSTAPGASGTPVLASGSDSGASNADNITSDTTPTITGSGAEAGATVTLYDTDGSTVLGTATADGSGNWTLTSSTLSEGAHTLTTKVTDTAGNTSVASASLAMTVDTTAPTAITLSANSVMDVATGTNTAVATLSSTDTQSVSYTLEAGNGTNDAGNASFVIAGGVLQSRSPLTAGTYNIRVGATDAAGNISYQTFVITVSTNTAPTITSVSTGTVAENAAISTVVYTATATDVDSGQTLSYSLTGTDAGSFDINASTGVVTLKASANYEAKASYSFNVVATDNGTGSLTDTKAVTVSVTDVNEAPTITSVSTGTVAENAAISTVVYTATATDVDSGQTLSYSLTGTDAGSFDINASTGVVTLKASANYEAKASYSFNVVATDNGTGSLTDTKAVTVSVTDVNDPATGSLTVSGTPKQGETLIANDTLADEDGITGKSYQWFEDGQPIVGANQSTFVLGQAQVGKVITVKVSYTDSASPSRQEEVISAATATVANLNDAATGDVTISGDAGVGQILSVTNTLADLDGMGTVTYQWQYKDANGQWQDIAQANGPSYEVQPQYALQELRVKATFTDQLNTTETVYSTTTVQAGGLPPSPVVLPQPAAPVITVVQAAPIEIVRPSVSSFLSSPVVNTIPMLTSDPLSSPIVMPLTDMPGQGAASGVVAVGVSPMAGTNFSGLRAMEASRDVVIERGEQASFTLPAGTFVHTDGNARVALSARLADGRPLPSFVKFDPTTGTFTVVAGSGEQAEQLQVVVNAVDDKGQTASTTVVIKLKEKARTSSVLDLQIKLGKPALAEQFRQAEKPAGAMAELAALSKAFAASHQERSRA